MSIFKKYFKRHARPVETGEEKRLLRKIGYWLIGIAGFFILWTLIGYLIFSKRGHHQFAGFLPIPTLKALYALLFDGDFWNSAFASLRRVVVGIAQAFVIGLPVGILIGFYKKLRIITYPPIQFIRMISPLSWMPIALIIFATFESAIYFLITMATIWPIILNTSLGVSRVNPKWLKMARNQGAKNHQLIFRVIIPASTPYILSSLRLALGVAWIVLVPAEFLGVSSGLGYIINDARDTMEYDKLMAIVVAIGILGFILDGTLQFVQKLLNWTWVREE
jgi:NitT/TauT family transport system permease protein